MDLQLYARVLWRFKLLVIAGVLVGAFLAVLSVARIGPDGISYRETVLYSSTTRVGVTQNGFPWGRLLAQQPVPDAAPQSSSDIPVADPNRLNSLAVLYAELATSDEVRGLMVRERPIPGKIFATPVVVGESRHLLPLVDVMAVSISPAASVALAQRAADALIEYVREEQRRNRVPTVDRVVVEQVVSPKPPQIFQPRSKTMPIVVFMAVMLLTVGLAFVLENLRPRTRPEAPSAEPGVPEAVRRTA